MLYLGLGMPLLTLLVMVERLNLTEAALFYGCTLLWCLGSSVLGLMAGARVLVAPHWRGLSLASGVVGLMATGLWWLFVTLLHLPGLTGLVLLSLLFALSFVPVVPAVRVMRAAQPGVLVLR